MKIIRFLHEYWGAATAITGIVALIVATLTSIWTVKRRPDKPESEKIGHKLRFRIRMLGRKIKSIRQKILGRRQTRAELVDIATSIDASLNIILKILSDHQRMLIVLKEKTNNPMTNEQIEAYYVHYLKPLADMIEEARYKKHKIESRTWEGITPYDENEKIKKRI